MVASIRCYFSTKLKGHQGVPEDPVTPANVSYNPREKHPFPVKAKYLETAYIANLGKKECVMLANHGREIADILCTHAHLEDEGKGTPLHGCQEALQAEAE